MSNVPVIDPSELGSWDKINELFHRLWGAAAGSPSYDKADWKKLQRHLDAAQYGSPGGSSRP